MLAVSVHLPQIRLAPRTDYLHKQEMLFMVFKESFFQSGRTMVAVAMGIPFFAFAGPLDSPASAERPPNFILIMADDAGWECFGCYGGWDYQTPHIDALAREGVRFQHCYSTPLCTPSRIQLMTGQYNFRNYTHFGYLSPKEKTFGHLLQGAGYQTAIAGKWQLNGLYNALPGHDDPARPLQAGFHESLLWQVTKGKQSRDGGGERFWQPPLEHNGRMISPKENQGKYGPNLFTDFICDFIERNRNRPFFVYYPMVLVHDPFVPTPDTIANRPLDTANIPPKDPAERKRNFVAMVNYMDKLVGRIAAKVRSLGLSENTILMFTADNGTHRSLRSRWQNPDNLPSAKAVTIRGGKGGMKDAGTHVPFVAHWKNRMPKGAVLPDLVDFADFYPTFAEAAGISLRWQDPVDGRSFLPQLKGQKGNPRDWILCHYQPYWGQVPGQFARTADFKLYRDGRFYKVSEDLQETNNLAAHIAPKIRGQLQSLLDRCPPAPSQKGGRETLLRSTYPFWENLLEPRP